jgi:uncharacterized NAD(P)/FAD-binding protein YdhS
MKTARIAIVGMGPRGLTVPERFAANQRAQKSGAIHIDIFDPNPPGTGCHDPDQAAHLLVGPMVYEQRDC